MSMSRSEACSVVSISLSIGTNTLFFMSGSTEFCISTSTKLLKSVSINPFSTVKVESSMSGCEYVRTHQKFANL